MAQQQIAAVNHWRGQCLDNFARAERVIILALEQLQSDGLAKLPETASQRTKHLAAAMRKKPFDQSKAGKVAKLLDLWSHREPQRNALVHGCFTVKNGESGEWLLLNSTLSVRKGKSFSDQKLITLIEGEAFLQAIAGERKALEKSLSELDQLRS